MFEKSQLLRCSTHAGHGEVVEGLVLKHLAEPGGNLSLRGMPHAKAGHAPGSLAAYYEERWRRTYEGWLPDGYVERTSSEESTSSMISHRYQILSTPIPIGIHNIVRWNMTRIVCVPQLGRSWKITIQNLYRIQDRGIHSGLEHLP